MLKSLRISVIVLVGLLFVTLGAGSCTNDTDYEDVQGSEMSIIGNGAPGSYQYEPTANALEALEDNIVIEVTANRLYYSFRNKWIDNDTGLIIHPGGAVDPRAYASIASRIAGKGYRVYILTTPSELVVAGVMPSMVNTVIAMNPDIQTWAVGGHSVGGVAAAQYIFNNPTAENVTGLVLWAAFPNPEKPISGRTDLDIVSIYGTNDLLVPQATVDMFKWALPYNTSYVQLEGANHAQFGDYGPQDGDGEATITHLLQEIRTKRATVDNVLADTD
jgi:pimeloyl-ACP methyl ester carboxylesterase